MIQTDPLVFAILLLFVAGIAAYIGWVVGNDRGNRR